MKNIVAVILARGGSKSIPKKNLINFCGKPLLAWSLEQAKNVKEISSIWVSSDDKKILGLAKKHNVNIIHRPKYLSKDNSSSISGWLHALKHIEQEQKVDLLVSLQPTSPVRESKDISKAIKKFKREKCDSMFSASILGDFLIWKKTRDNKFQSVNFDHKKRVRRQISSKQFIENGSFYIIKPDILRRYHSPLAGKISMSIMEFWKSFEIDDYNDIEFSEVIMKHYLLKNKALGRNR